MSTAIIAHADRDGIAASALILKHREPSGRVFPVGRAQDVASIIQSCSESACPSRIYIIGYFCSVPSDTWSSLHPQNVRILWFDHHLDEWRKSRKPPEDMVRVYLPNDGEMNSPAAMVARHLFGDVTRMPPEDIEFLRRIYEALPADEIIDFIDGLHSEISGVKYSEMTDFIKAVIQRRIPLHYQHFLKTSRTLKKTFLKFLSARDGWETDGRVIMISGFDQISRIPRAVLSSWARSETGAKAAILDLGQGKLYLNIRHDVRIDLQAVVRSVKGMDCQYVSGHPYAVYADGCSMQDGRAAQALFDCMSRKLLEGS